jgi:molecular chaperone DnaJ
MSESFYDVLDVEADATTEEIERAYRRKVKETHPDVSDDPDAEDRFKLVQQAKGVLTDDTERDRYDRLGHDRYLAREQRPFEGDEDTASNPTDAAADATSSGATAGGTGSDSAGGGRRRQRRADWDDPFGWEETADASTSDTTTGETSTDAAESDSGTRDAAESDSGASTVTGQFGAAGDGQRGWNQSRSESSSQQGSYATRTTYREQSFDTVRVPLTPRSIIQITSMFVFYPVFVAASIFPVFPTTVNLVVGLCTLFIIAYLMSIPEVAIVVFGGWSVLTPILLVALDPFSLFSLVGIIALVAAWFPFGLAFLTRAALRS